MQPSTTPSPSAGKIARITDYFPPIKQSGQVGRSKRELDGTSTTDTPPAKRQRTHEKSTTSTSLRTVRLDVDIDITDLKADTPKRKRKTPPSARLLDDTDGGLHDSLVDRWVSLKETGAEEDATSVHKRPRPSVPVQAPASVKSHKRKRLASSRLLDHVDEGLSDSLVGRRYEEKASSGGKKKNDNATTHYSVDDNTMDDDSEAETIRVDNSEEDMSSDDLNDDLNDDDNEEDGDDGDASEGNDSDKENVPPRMRYRTPSLPPLPATPEHHESQNETGDATSSGQSSTSPSSLLLPSPVVDLPPLPSSSSSSSSTLVTEPSTLPSPPSSP